MKSLLKVSAAVMMLAVMAVAMVLFFGSMDRSRGQLPAAAPTPLATVTSQATLPLLTNPIITPVVSSTPRPVPSVIIDPTWVPNATAGTPVPTPTRAVPGSPPSVPTARPATGGPYISQAKAIEAATGVASMRGNRVSASVPPRATFTQAKNLKAMLGNPRPASTSEREIWVITFEGVFTPLSTPPGAPPSCYAKMHVVIDATTGEWSQVALVEEIPCS